MSRSAHSTTHRGKNHTPDEHHPKEDKARLKENFLFLSKFLRHGTTIASFWPSSKALSRATIKQIDWDNAKVIVELGAGTGPITDQIIKRLKPDTIFIAIERDGDFAKVLQKRFANRKNVHIVKSDVRDLDTVLKSFNVKKVDAFV